MPMGHGELILVVDDELSVCKIAKATLETYGYRVITAGDGTEAVTEFLQHAKDIQVVLTDMAMPYMDGPSTIRALRKIEPQIKIIATSGLTSDADLLKMASTSVQAFLSKPYTAEQLLRVLRTVLVAPV